MISSCFAVAGPFWANASHQRPFRESSRWHRHVELMLALVLCFAFLGRLILCVVPDEHAKVAVATPALACVASTRTGRSRKARRSGEPPIDCSVRAASYARYSSDRQSDKSIVDQQRECREHAERHGHEISPGLEFVDEAISGTKRDRTGLNGLLAAAEAGQMQVLYFHSLSRLSRESVITLPLLKELVYKYDVRIVSVTEGIDSNETSWELIAHIMSIVHEQYLKDLAANVLRGQEGTLLEGHSVGDHCFGYGSQVVSGNETLRHGRKDKLPKIYVIDPESAAWVERIFHWFVVDRRSLRWIARELNRLDAPKDHRATTKNWRHQYLPRLLSNRKYKALWPWGEKRNVRDPLTGKITQKDRSPEECEKWLRHFPHLRLIDDETFAEAGRLLKENEDKCAASRKKSGKFTGSKPGADHLHPRHLLSGLVRCSECGSTLNVGGANGKYLFCPTYQQGGCSCQTQLRRDRAEKMILDEIGKRILAVSTWRQAVLDAALAYWHAQEAHLPTELAAAEKALADVERRVTNLLDRIENGDDMPELNARLSERRAEKQELTTRVERLCRADDGRRPEPTEAWVGEQLSHLGDTLSDTGPAAAYALRDLVGGQIVVTEVRRSDRQRHYLQGRFAITSTALVTGLIGSAERAGEDAVPDSDGLVEEIVIDFREPPEIEALSKRAKELHDEGMMNAEIAEQLGCSRSRLTKILKHWFESRGLEMPDGRSRRASLGKKHLEPPLFQEIADDVMRLYDLEVLMQDIAEQLNVDRNTVTSTVRWWHESKGLPVPDGRTRRKGLDRKTSQKSD